jgi:FkbM family methyltransferase
MDEIKLVFNFFAEQPYIGTMIDVGAMDGCSCKRFVTAGWTVVAFEPNPSQRHKLIDFHNKNKTGKLIVEETAVSNKNRKNCPFFTSEESTGISSLVAFHQSHKKSHAVDTVRLDDYMNKHKITVVNFLKIDTEGYDYYVLQSYPWHLYKPEIVVCEFEDKKTKDKLNYLWTDVAHFLKKKGYYIIISEWYPIKKYGARHEWRNFKKYPCILDDIDGWGNMIAFSKREDRDDFYKSYIK